MNQTQIDQLDAEQAERKAKLQRRVVTSIEKFHARMDTHTSATVDRLQHEPDEFADLDLFFAAELHHQQHS